MSGAILVINAGSSSIKFAIFTIEENSVSLRMIYRGEIAGIGHQPHWGTMIFTERGPAFSGDDNFLDVLNKTKEEVYPYKYKYDRKLVSENDIHVGEDGWSS